VQSPARIAEIPARLRWGTVLGILFVLGLTVAMPLFDGGERLRALVDQSGAWSPVVYVAAKAAATIVAPLSGVPLKATSGALFGLAAGMFYSVLGDVIGGCACFWASRLLGRGTAERFAGKQGINRAERFASYSGEWRVLLVGRLALSSVYNLVSYAAGLTRLPFWQYLMVTVFGGSLHTGFLVVLGASVVLDWRLRLATYAGIAALALLALLGSRRLQRALVRDRRFVAEAREEDSASSRPAA
jgi:uncharacterized membrane protein YdjX (TVP38/TMEM64 family)